MQWTDEGIVLGVKRHGEANAILELMTREHGRHLGLVRGGAGRMMRPVLQAGNLVSAVWRARLDQHLGHYVGRRAQPAGRRRCWRSPMRCTASPTSRRSAACCRSAIRIRRSCRWSRRSSTTWTTPPLASALLVQFELQLLTELGFGLELDACAVTGTRDELIYVSPKSGRAVSRQAGEPWRDQLLRLPAFLSGSGDVDPPLRTLPMALR